MKIHILEIGDLRIEIDPKSYFPFELKDPAGATLCYGHLWPGEDGGIYAKDWIEWVDDELDDLPEDIDLDAVEAALYEWVEQWAAKRRRERNRKDH